MEIQQHDGVVLMELQYSGRASLSTMEVEEVLGREKEATKGLRCGCPPSPPLYIGARQRGEAQPCPFLQGRGAAKGGEESILPKARGRPPLGFPPNPRRLGPWWEGAPAHLGMVPSHTWPMHPPGAGGPTWWTPGTLPVVPVRYR